MSDDVTEYLSEEAKSYAHDHIGVDIDIGAVVVPPVPRERVKETVKEYQDVDELGMQNDLLGHLYDLTDIALAVNHAGDPILNSAIEVDETRYTSSEQTREELKVAHGALISSFNRELRGVADRLTIEYDEDTDLVTAIRDELEYEVDVSIDEEWTELDTDE